MIPETGEQYFQKRLQRYGNPDEPRELTFSCFQKYALLSRDRTREWFQEAIEGAREKFPIQIWAYVIMPDHVHLLIQPGRVPDQVSSFLKAIKEPIARRAIAYLKENAPTWLERLRVVEGTRIRHRFWQPGGGYDRNVIDTRTLRSMIEYIHANPVRRGLVASAEDWEWSSAR